MRRCKNDPQDLNRPFALTYAVSLSITRDVYWPFGFSYLDCKWKWWREIKWDWVNVV